MSICVCNDNENGFFFLLFECRILNDVCRIQLFFRQNFNSIVDIHICIRNRIIYSGCKIYVCLIVYHISTSCANAYMRNIKTCSPDLSRLKKRFFCRAAFVTCMQSKW